MRDLHRDEATALLRRAVEEDDEPPGVQAPEEPAEDHDRVSRRDRVGLRVDRDRVVAEIVPPQPGRTALRSEDDFIAQGVREGWLTPAKIPAGTPFPPRKPVMSFEELMADSERDREDR